MELGVRMRLWLGGGGWRDEEVRDGGRKWEGRFVVFDTKDGMACVAPELE